MAVQVDHVPRGDPCDCGWPFEYHRVKHKFKAAYEDEYKLDECSICGLPQRNHRNRQSQRRQGTTSRRIHRKSDAERESEDKRAFVGFDGEGCGRGPHRYVMLCVRDEYGTRADSVENPNGLSTEECLEFIMRQPRDVRMFGYALGYDLTKIFADLPDVALYALQHPEERMPPKTNTNPFPKPIPVMYRAPGSKQIYYINLLSSRLDIQVGTGKRTQKGKRKVRTVTIWDIFRFFGTSFVRALTDWDVASKEVRDRIQAMKEKRGEDDWMNDPKAIVATRTYCFDECQHLGQLARKLVEAHKEAGLELKKFYGAGSSADAMMKAIGVKEKIVRENGTMKVPIMSAFFGGRFENSVVGAVPGPLYNIDIASAYPYQITYLPCLVHGVWTRSRDRKRLEEVRGGIVRYRLPRGPEKHPSWGPLPYRSRDGTIVYPVQSGGGWVWRDEFLAAERLCPHIEFVEAYLLDSDCDCQPFSKVPEWYRERLKIGKEGAGIVFKLGPNSIYGKLAQSIGAEPPYQCFTWAGITTSGCRAQLLDVLALHRNRANVLAMATDGVISRERISLPEPQDTGTSMAIRSPKEILRDTGKLCRVCGSIACVYAHKPLGSWELKVADKGVFFARPGIYFDLGGKEDDDSKIRARGVGRKTLLKYVAELKTAWARGDEGLLVEGGEHPRFKGMKSAVRRRPDGSYARSADYGEWVPMPVDMSFSPLPKRDAIVRKKGESFGTLTVRTMPLGEMSVPYGGKAAVISKERLEFIEAAKVMMDQPDVEDLDFGDE